MESGEFDVALRSVIPPPGNLVARPLGQLKNILVRRPQWLATHPITAPDGVNHVECLQSTSHPWWNDWALQSTEKALLKTQGNLSMDGYSSRVALAECGIGVACLPLSIVEALLNEDPQARFSCTAETC